MKSNRIAAVIVAIITLATTSAFAQTDAQKGFDAIKTLPGTWAGKGPDGKPLQVTFKVTSAGSAVMSEILIPRRKKSLQMSPATFANN